MQSRIPGFRGEFLWELDVTEIQLLALAEAIPGEVYPWRPADRARSLSEVLVHVAAGNFLLLRYIGACTELYDSSDIGAMVAKNRAMEKSVREKPAVIDLLRRSFQTVRRCFTAAADAELERQGDFFGEFTTVRRVYLRMLAHSHEHMGQAIAYARCNGIRAPWPDPVDEIAHDAGRIR